MARRKQAAQAAAPLDETVSISSEPTPLETPTSEVTDPAVAAQQIVQQVADNTTLPDAEKQPFAERVRRADPFPSHSYLWPDGYSIGYQESDSRKTVEIQFGEGTRADQPQNFEQIKPFLREEGMYWNGTNAWVLDLVPERGSLAQREDARRTNRDIRARVEDVILPAVVAMEEEKRGEIEVTDETRQRINKARGGGHGGPG